MKKLDLNNLDNISGGLKGYDEFNFGEAETLEEINGWIDSFDGDRYETLQYLEAMADDLNFAYKISQDEKSLKQAQYYSHLYNSMEMGKYDQNLHGML